MNRMYHNRMYHAALSAAISRIVVVAAVLVLAVGCATGQRTEDVRVNTVPSGATVHFSNGVSCTSPCQIEAERKTSLIVTIIRDGCQPHAETIASRVTTRGVIFGGISNYRSGAVHELKPNPLIVNLICDEEESVSQ